MEKKVIKLEDLKEGMKLRSVENLFINLINKLNEVDGGGWEFDRLGGERELEMNLFVYWDI